MTDIHKRVSRRINNFQWNNKSADRVAAEILQMVAAASAIEARSDATTKIGAAKGKSAGPKDDAQTQSNPDTKGIPGSEG